MELDRGTREFEAARHSAQQRFDHAEVKCTDLSCRFQKSEENNRRLSAENSSCAQSLSSLRQTLETQSAEYYKEVHLLRLSQEKEREALAQTISLSSGGCRNCPVLLQKIAELQNEIAELGGRLNALSIESESLRASMNSTG